VVTVHDLGYLHEPEAHPPAHRRYLGWSTRWSVGAARLVIAPSCSTRADVLAHVTVPPDRVRVVPHGVDAAFRPLPLSETESARRRLGLPDRFVLAVGTVQPRKNLGRLAVALRGVAAAGLPHRLVIAGKAGWLADRVERDIAASGMGDRVHRLGYVAAADLPALYGAADAFAFPSLHEGFGLPALEALACGTPTLVADRAALPEVVGDAALRVPPEDPDAIGAALLRLLTDQSLRARLEAAGPARAAAFTWRRAADQTLSLLREAMEP
jgi:glycosyltransferase involved in cell wall biosynthesis